jgi:3-oxoacyl-[acyl-carrier-protein] synthase III
MIVKDIGILGMGLWDGPVVENQQFQTENVSKAEVKDPYRGRRDDSGVVRIAGMEFTPQKHRRTIAALERSFQDPYRGTKRRRYFAPDMKVSDAETDAARRAISDANLTAADIDTVLVQSFLPDEIQPKNAAIIAQNLGIKNAPAWEVDSICNSAITHLNVGAALIKAGMARHVLCIQSAAYSRVADQSASAIQEGDMAASFVMGPSPGTEMSFSWRTDGRLHGAIKLRWGNPAGSPPRPYWARSQEKLLIHFDPILQEQVMAEIAGNARVVCAEALQRAELAMGDLEIIVPHQPMSWFNAFLADVLEVGDGIIFDTFEEYSSINSASIPATLHDARRAGRIRRGTKALLFGPAAGYTFGAVAIRW